MKNTISLAKVQSARSLGVVAAATLLPMVAAAQAPTDAGPGATQTIEAYLSEDALQVFYGREMEVGDFGRNEVRAGVFFNEDRDLIGMADMLFNIGTPERRPYWSLEAGPRAYGALLTVESQDVFAIGLGGRLSYYIGRSRNSWVSLTAFYAPDIVTFGNADNIKDVAISAETRLSDTTSVFVGYRNFELDLEVDREVDDNVHIGIRHRF